MFWRERDFIQRDTKYFRYTAKMEEYTKFVYTAKLERYAKYCRYNEVIGNAPKEEVTA